MTHSYCNATPDPIDVTFCTSQDHHADNAHPDPDPDEITLTITTGGLLTFSETEDNAADILAQMTDFTEKN